MSTLQVSSTTDYSGGILLPGITSIDFTNAVLTTATATFAAAQVDGAPISLTAQIDGSSGTNRIVINGGSANLSQWTFTTWSVTADRITLNGTLGDDVLVGSTVRDTIQGSDGRDTITGGFGLDTMFGGSGNDTFIYLDSTDYATGEIIDGGDGGADTIELQGGSGYAFNTAVISGVERLRYGAAANAVFVDSVIGPGGINLVIGSADANRFEVMGTTIDVSNVTFKAWRAADSIFLTGDTSAANTIVGSGKKETLSGGSAADALNGGGGNDILVGGGGSDSMLGGGGNDIFRYASGGEAAAAETVAGGGGKDTIDLILGGTFDFGGVSISAVERVRFSGFGGALALADSQIGGTGGRIAIVIGNAGVDHLTVTGTAVDLSGVTFSNWSASDTIAIVGEAGASNVLTGSSRDDVITGGNLDDVIAGGAGADDMNGGGGIDTLSYAGDSTGVVINLSTGTADFGDAAGDVFSGFTNVIGGSGDDTLGGNAAGNVLEGRGGDDVLVGGTGVDTLLGGGGNDTFLYNFDEEVEPLEVIDGGGGNFDKIVLDDPSPSGWVFIEVTISGVEQVEYRTAGPAAFLDSQIGGGAGQISNVKGSAGGNTLVVFGAAADLTGLTFTTWSPLQDGVFMLGSTGSDHLIGSSQTDVIRGSDGADVIDGGGGTDVIFGGVGQDVLTGGANADRFSFEAANESAVGSTRDRITDFDQGNDLLVLPFAAGFDFRGSGAFTNTAGELRFFHNVNNIFTVLEADVDGNGSADFQLRLDGSFNLALADFVL